MLLLPDASTQRAEAEMAGRGMVMGPGPPVSAAKLADSVGFDLLGDELGADLKAALKTALAGGVVFQGGGDALAIFRSALVDSIRDIERDRRGLLFQRFLRDGPYEGEGSIPPNLRGKRLTMKEATEAISFIYSSMVNSFKGSVTELLAAAACHRLMKDKRLAGALPSSARLYVGDAVLVHDKSGKRRLKGADLHILLLDERKPKAPWVTVYGMVEVKSGRKSPAAMGVQLENHIQRAQRGLEIAGADYPGENVFLGVGPKRRILRITVQPSDWPLPRTLRFETTGKTRRLTLDPPIPPAKEDQLIPMGDDRWHIALRWSKEAIAAAAYEMTFWYMEKVGEVIYTRKGDEPDPKPKDWAEMTPAEAGRNAIKMMLYYAIRPDAIRANRAKERNRNLPLPIARRLSRAIALYNTYCFGYALGMNFHNKDGRREMLWPQDLDEIAANGCTKHGYRVV